MGSMPAVFRGSLFSISFLESELAEMGGSVPPPSLDRRARAFRRWWLQTCASVGPATGLRLLIDCAAVPLAAVLGFDLQIVRWDTPAAALGLLTTARGTGVPIAIVTWNASLNGVWRAAVREALASASRWCFCFNGSWLRLVDAHRSYARRHLDIDLAALADDDGKATLALRLLAAESFEGPSFVEQALQASDRHASSVCASLQQGVREALSELLLAFAAGRRPGGKVSLRLDDCFDQALTIVYRVLFLLFAEARHLVPVWHPVYRDSYTIESLRRSIDDTTPARGLWEALQAICRLAHAGCRAGDLHVTPFNGRLFAPSRTPMAESRVGDHFAGRAVLALTTRVARDGHRREPIAYRDLGVEQLGAVYEGVLDYVPELEPDGRNATVRIARRPGDSRRKATGTFYTPRSLTDFLVRRTLHPLTHTATAEQILGLRVLDPSMGSGAFLVSAGRYLAAAYENALVANGDCASPDIDDGMRAGFRRTIAQRCLYGVDLNPMAVQLARLSLWLATLAADRPLTFLDHHFRAGDSLVGASLDDLARQPPARIRRRRPGSLPLFDPADLPNAMSVVVPERWRLALQPDDTVAIVRDKERALEDLCAPAAPLARWKRAADLWCACWFWDGSPVPSRKLFGALQDAVLARQATSVDAPLGAWLQEAARIAAAHRFFHWTLEFPEIFFDETGRPLPNPGFDAILGNPPWDVVRADGAEREARARERSGRQRLVRFARDAGVYRELRDGHPNSYQLFIERAHSLLRRGGRLGMIVPSGLALDRGCSGLRRMLLDRCDTDMLVGFENRSGVFPIHRSVRFLLVTSTKGGSTTRLRCRFGERDPSSLDTVPDEARDPASFPVTLTRAFIARVSGDACAIPELRTPLDVAIVDSISARVPPFGSPEGWNIRFGRELNATDDREHFVEVEPGFFQHWTHRASDRQMIPVVEGKQLEPFAASLRMVRYGMAERTARALLGRGSGFTRRRLAYRDVASPTNRLTLIAAIVPARAVTTHTVFCLQSELSDEQQAYLCGVLNSFVANYLVRPRVTTHVSVAVIERLPMPRFPSGDPVATTIAKLAAMLSMRPAERAALSGQLQGLVARLYGLTDTEFQHVLGTFPLVEDAEKRVAFEQFKGGSP
ncbi:MAG: N-6 DNA methylase [Acidobacteria bacterium]|nr:N-6 DNA methylase [Acidobacteriota bacterium]